jgi:phospholipase/carboxylesterase
MWIFAGRLPDEHLLVAPRGLYAAPLGGYGWLREVKQEWPRLAEFKTVVTALEDLNSKKYFPMGDFSQLHLVGFSQGAALAAAYSLLMPRRVRALACLSGFLPEGIETVSLGEEFYKMPIFITHGTQDKLVPVDRARSAVRFFHQAGADVSYCEAEVGHKLGAACFKALEMFFEDLA